MGGPLRDVAQSAEILRFGPFEVDLRSQELRRKGMRIRLPAQSFQVLATLLNRPGDLVTREELQRKLWPAETFGDLDHGLNAAVNRVREALDDSAEQPRFIETLPRRGYRFISPVERDGDGSAKTALEATANAEVAVASGQVLPDETETAPSTSAASTRTAYPIREWWKGRRFAVALAPLLLLLSGGAFLFQYLKQNRHSAQFVQPEIAVLESGRNQTQRRGNIPSEVSDISVQTLTAIPLTTDQGNEVQPTLSPDGNEVAFAYSDGRSFRYHIFEKAIGSEGAVRLTTDSTNDRNPSWSPDGQNIAFLRFDSDQNARIMTIPSVGGAEKEIATLQVDPTEPEVSVSWSPNGEWIATSEAETPHSPMSLVLISALTGEKRRVLYEPAPVDADLSPSFSPDGRYLAFARHLGSYTADIYILEIPQEDGTVSQARRLTNSTRMNKSPVWTRDGQSIIFVGDHSQFGFRIWRIPVFNHGDAVLLNEIGQDSSSIALSAGTNRLVYAKYMEDRNIWRINLDPVLSEAGHRREISKSRLIASTRQDFNPQYSPDGKQIAYQSDRSGDFEIWLADRDGTSPRQLTHLHAEVSGFPRWSPDGKYIVFHSRLNGYANLFIVNVKTGDYRKLTAGLGNDTAPSWSHDGKWIYFESEREAGVQIWRVPASGGSANRLTKTDGVAALESVDGKTLYFSKVSDPGLWSLPLAGGTESKVLPSLYGVDNFAVAKRGIYFVRPAPESQAIISFKDFSSGAIEDLAVLEVPIGSGLAVSPDERSILYTQLDRSDSDLFLVDNFR
jgi:Tol biopolymer transport system component/DNA-binding winged helix-turn-helix (wHTH) protein